MKDILFIEYMLTELKRIRCRVRRLYNRGFSFTIRLWVKFLLQARWHLMRRSQPHNLPGELIVSLTSYPPRYGTLALTLRCLLTQTRRADRTILWVSQADAALLPENVTNLMKRGLEIITTDDIKSYKKIIPAIERFPHAFICTADDDLYYWPTWLEELLEGASITERVINCHRAHGITVDTQGKYNPYNQWIYETPIRGKSKSLFPTNGGGALYYPGSLAPEVLDREAFSTLCPHGDDIWLYWMSRRAGTTYRTIGRRRSLITWAGSQDEALYHFNMLQGGNDEQIRKMAERYGYPEVS